MAESGVLHVIGGNDRGKRFDLTLPETRIGRGTDQDVVLSDIAVSRRHVTIHLEAGRYRLQDLGSGNGTLVNGQRIDSHPLKDGDHIEIGQTVMRFDHPVSRVAAGGQAGGFAPPPVYVPPQPRQVPPAPSAAMPTGSPFETPQSNLQETPSDAVMSPVPESPRAQPYTGSTWGSRWSNGLSALSSFSKSIANPIDTPLKKALVFGGMGLVSIIALLIIFARTAWAHPQIVPSDAEELYKQGLRLFGSGDYEGAKVNFAEAANQAPTAPEPKRYAGLCDIEIRAHGLMKSAERALTAHQYGEAMKALSQVDSSSISSPEAAELRRQTAPKAAAQDVDEAQRLALDDPDGARAKLKEALTFDPGSADARALVARIKSGAPMQAAAVATKEPEPARTPEPEHVDHSKHAHHEHEHEHAPELAPVKIGSSHGGGGALSGAALSAYRAKDFGGADRAMRIESTHQSTKQALKTIELANQIRQLKQTLDRADGEEGKNPSAAARDLTAALSLDAKISRGVHAGWLKARLGRVQLSNAQSAFRQGHYDVAYRAVSVAEKLGAGDGGLRRQLETKASELVQRGQSVQRSNLNQAKQYWRMVMHMVPSSSSTYAKAYSLLNNAAAKQQDQDED